MQEQWEGLTHSGKTLNIRLAQINPIVGNLEYNSKLIKDIIISSEKFDLLVFPELSLTGYPPQDLLLDNNFIVLLLLSKSSNVLHFFKLHFPTLEYFLSK